MSNPTPTSYHVEPEPARRRRPLIIVGILAAVLAIGGGAAFAATRGAGHHPAEPHRTLFVQGHITATASPFTIAQYARNPYAIGCSPDAGYKDLPGAEVTVTDDAGRTLAIGHLDQGRFVAGDCSFAFTVADIPTGTKFYKLAIGRRGTLTYTEAQLSAGPLDLTLG